MKTEVDLSSMDRWAFWLTLVGFFVFVSFNVVSCTERVGKSLNKLREECKEKGGRLIDVRYEGYICVKEFGL